MRWTDTYAIVATGITLFLLGWGILGLRKPGPQRGMGGAYAAIMILIVISVAVLHGLIVSGIALYVSRNPVTWTAVAVHGLIPLGYIIRIKTS